MVAPSESGELAKDLITDCLTRQQITRDTLTIHADRGTSMTSKPVAQLLVDLGVIRSHSRPHVSNDNPYSEANVQDPEVLPGVPRPVRLDRRRPSVLRRVLRLLQPRAPPQRDRPAHPRLGALRHRGRDPRPTRGHPRRGLRRQPDPIHPSTECRRSCPPSPGSTNPHSKHSSNPHEKLSHSRWPGSGRDLNLRPSGYESDGPRDAGFGVIRLHPSSCRSTR